jgi:hypothetical protein
LTVQREKKSGDNKTYVGLFLMYMTLAFIEVDYGRKGFEENLKNDVTSILKLN